MNNDIIICTAPIHIHRVLQFMEDNPDDYTIICPGEMKPFFRQFTDCTVIVPWVHPNLFTRKNLKWLPLNLIRLLRNQHHYFTHVKGQQIHVFFTGWAVSFMYFIKRLHKKNVVHLWLPEDNYPHPPDYFKEQKDIVSACMRWFARLFLGLKTTVMDKSVPAYEMDRSNYNQHLYDPDKMAVYRKLMKDNKLVEGMDVLFLSENVTTEGAELESVERISNYLYTILEENYAGRWCLKGHPREPDTYGYLKTAGHEVSRYIIAEILYGHKWKAIISYYSEALISASKLTDAKVISLMEFLVWDNQDLKRYWRDRFIKFNVLCPRSLGELKEMLK